eukprot:PhM_4_TR237/c0_g1_i1/m.81402/K12823/DDX5, DBP2; ATP-dependent RNA helicase DDX5/DBP2
MKTGFLRPSRSLMNRFSRLAVVVGGVKKVFDDIVTSDMQYLMMPCGRTPHPNPPTPFTSVSELRNHLSPLFAEQVEAQGFESLTQIQAHSMPALLRGTDVVGLAPTGSGKTLAFGLCALKHATTPRSTTKKNSRIDPGTPVSLILSPTRELAQQSAEVLSKLSGDECRVAACYGGAENRRIQSLSARRAEVLVATPGRLMDFLDDGVVSLDETQFVVLDEADELLSMGFEKDIEDIMNIASARSQTALFSATWTKRVERLAGTFLRGGGDAVIVSGGTHETGVSINKNITQSVHYVTGTRDKLQALDAAIAALPAGAEKSCKVLIFVNRKDSVEEVATALHHHKRNARVGTLHGGQSQSSRESTLFNFKASSSSSALSILVATDVAARGLDIPNVACVVCWDFPQHFVQYVHRIGRTGRGGAFGSAALFLSHGDRRDLTRMEQLKAHLTRCCQTVPNDLILPNARKRGPPLYFHKKAESNDGQKKSLW